ncbi:MAG: hypothetical protein IJY93_07705 [Clostridia bacterium]|nr:hypothetical protein [Clostridia bacterium]
MARKFKIFAYVTVLIALMFCFVGCSDDLAKLDISADTYSYTPDLNLFEELITDDTQTQAAEAAEITDLPETVSLPETADTQSALTDAVYDDTVGDVYWVGDGEVWHLTRGCWTLARSKKILSGTVEAAITAGKTRVCQVCGG